MTFPTKEQIVWLIGQHVSGLSEKQLNKVLRIAIQQLMIRKGVGRMYIVDGYGNEVYLR